MIEGLTAEQAVVAGLAVVGVSTILFLRRIDSKVESAASKEDLARVEKTADEAATKEDLEEVKEDLDGVGRRLGAVSDRLIAVDAKVDAQIHRIDEHASRNADLAKNYRELVDDITRENRRLKEKRP